MELHGYPYPYNEKDLASSVPGEGKPTAEGEGPGVGEGLNSARDSDDDKEELDVPPALDSNFYCLSEAGEGAMAWEATLQSMFPGVKAFWNRLLSDGKSQRLGTKVCNG